MLCIGQPDDGDDRERREQPRYDRDEQAMATDAHQPASSIDTVIRFGSLLKAVLLR